MNGQQSSNESWRNNRLWQFFQVLAKKRRRGRRTGRRFQIGVSSSLERGPQSLRQSWTSTRKTKYRRALESVNLDVVAQSVHHEGDTGVEVRLDRI